MVHRTKSRGKRIYLLGILILISLLSCEGDTPFKLYIKPPAHGSVTGGEICFISLKSNKKSCTHIDQYGTYETVDISYDHPYKVTFESDRFRGIIPYITPESDTIAYLSINKVKTIQPLSHHFSILTGINTLYNRDKLYSFSENKLFTLSLSQEKISSKSYPIKSEVIIQMDQKRLLLDDQIISVDETIHSIPLIAQLPQGDKILGQNSDGFFLINNGISTDLFRILQDGYIERLILPFIPEKTPESQWITLNNTLFYYNGALYQYANNRFKECHNYPGGVPVPNGNLIYTVTKDGLLSYNPEREEITLINRDFIGMTLYSLNDHNTLILPDLCLIDEITPHILIDGEIFLITTTPNTLLCNFNHIDLGSGHFILFNPEPFNYKQIEFKMSQFHLLTLPQ